MKAYSIIFFLFFSFFSYSQIFDYLPTSTTNQIVSHSYYSLSYSENHEQAEWVAYELSRERVSGSAERTNNFRVDRKVNSGSAVLNDYKGSGYDRGHLVPAGDVRFSKLAMSESFYLSNISPQTPSFNQGIWKKLEKQVRTWAYENEHLYIITAGVLSSCSSTIGHNKVGVPDYYYKVILDYNEPEIKAIALVLPNKKGTQQLSYYVTSIDYVESITGIDFFPELPDYLEDKLESKSYVNQWSWKSTSFSSLSSISTTKQCQGTTLKNRRCKRKTKSNSGYCYQHKSKINSIYNNSSKETITLRCSSNTKSSKRCKRKTKNISGRCWQHQY